MDNDSAQNTALYNELREKIAFAMESRMLIFLDDEQLERFVNTLFPYADKLRATHPGIPFRVIPANVTPEGIFVNIDADIEKYQIDKSIVELSNKVVNELIKQYLNKHPKLKPEDLTIRADAQKSGIKFSIEKL